MKALDLRKKNKEDLNKELIELRKAQFSSRMQISTQQTNKNDHCLLYTSDAADE